MCPCTHTCAHCSHGSLDLSPHLDWTPGLAVWGGGWDGLMMEPQLLLAGVTLAPPAVATSLLWCCCGRLPARATAEGVPHARPLFPPAHSCILFPSPPLSSAHCPLPHSLLFPLPHPPFAAHCLFPPPHPLPCPPARTPCCIGNGQAQGPRRKHDGVGEAQHGN